MANRGNHDGTEETTVVLRKFGINETYQLAMYLLDQYRGTTLSCRYEIPPRLVPAESRTQLEEAVKVAVVDTIMKHPMLQVAIVDHTLKTPSWIQLPSLDLTQHIQWNYLPEHDDFEHTVQETFRTQLDGRFPDLSIKQPGWKITIIRQGNAPVMEVLLTWNHPQFDAMGAKVFHEDLIEMLNAQADAADKNNNEAAQERTGLLDGHILRLPQAPPLLPIPLESLTKLPVDLKFLVKALWEEIRPKFIERWDTSWAAWCPIRASPYKTQYRAFFLDNASMQAIQALCRKNQTTITGLLNGLALIAFSSHLDTAVASAFQSSNIVDHRRNLPPAPPEAPWVRSDRAVSNYVTQCLHKWDTELVARIRSKLPGPADTDTDATVSGEGGRNLLSADLQRELWAASARNRQEIVDKLKDPLRNDIVGLFQYVTDWQATMRGLAKRTRQFSWLVTNIGVLDGNGSGNGKASSSTTGGGGGGGDTKSDDRWSIGRAQFGLSAEVPAAAIEFSPVSVAGRGMCVAATWADCAVDVTLGESIMADLERWLAQLASQS
ncbi:hypothetical protein QBC40DRAFT_275163 [Triangularia verruculosa]|uniref:Alcohol acetyltransferase n=1 Tax=Triangularia verruculosa TaxID=2587418 RepID=A0AAN6XLU4_9PEZI|nr:hypothetical protein QBC40DRAFT_275163 [Triangularia verruculosa]